MVKKDLVRYIEKQIAKGIHVDLIKHALLEVGHDIESVEEAIRHVHGKRKVHVHLNRYIIPLVLIVVLVGIALFLKYQAPDIASLFKGEVEEKLVGDVGEEEEQEILGEDVGTGEQSPEPEIAEGVNDSFWFNRAMAENNESLCNNIQEEIKIDTCKNAFSPPEVVGTS